MNAYAVNGATQTVAQNGGQDSGNIFRQMLDSFTSAPGDTIHYVEQLDYGQILVALTLSAIMGALIAFHPKRQAESGGPASDKELKKTMIIIPVAGAVMVALVQGSLERAFGLVGLGSFVRYRTAMRNPVDLSIIFILIGLGMACGLQQYRFALTITGFLYILLYILEFTSGAYLYTWNLKIDSTKPLLVERVFVDLAKENNFHIIRIRSSKQGGQFRCRFTAKKQIDTDKLTEDIKEYCGEDVFFTRVDWELNKQ